MPERIDGGRALAGIGAVTLIVSLFLDWFKPAMTAWDAFEVLDLVLTFLGLVVIVHVTPALARSIRAPEAPPALLPIVGIVAFVIVAAALINHPPSAAGRGLAFGAWLGLAATVLMVVGGFLSAARVSVMISVRPRPPGTHERRDRGRRGPRRSPPPPPEPGPPPPREPFDAETETRAIPEAWRDDPREE
jgi:hypothetical protein